MNDATLPALLCGVVIMGGFCAAIIACDVLGDLRGLRWLKGWFT